MHVQEHSPGDGAALMRLVRAQRDAQQRDRYRVVLLVFEGLETQAIQDHLSRSRGFVQRWAYAYRDGGIAAVNPQTGDSSALLTPTVNTDYMNVRLAFISRPAGPNKHVVLVLDQAGWHVAKGLKVPENITLFHLPPYSPELNPIERIWAYLKSHYLRNRVFMDYDDLLNACRSAWNLLTEERLQFVCRTDWLTHEVQMGSVLEGRRPPPWMACPAPGKVDDNTESRWPCRRQDRFVGGRGLHRIVQYAHGTKRGC